MPSLIVQLPSGLHGCTIDQRILIGRRKSCDVLLNHPSVSRIHAWIILHDGLYVLFDNASRTGTYVNATRLREPHILTDGDQIDIGPAHITYSVQDTLADGVTPLPEPLADTTGVAFTCTCGNLLWVPSHQAGLQSTCRRCGRQVVVPLPQTQHEELSDDAIIPLICGICQCKIEPDEATTTCPGCALVFHAECWIENHGCAAYGCSHVNFLETEDPQTLQPQELIDEPQLDSLDDGLEVLSPPTTWGLLFMAMSLFASVLGLATFGTTALILMVISMRYLMRHQSTLPPLQRKRIIIAAIIAGVSVPIGIISSALIWL